MSVMPGFRLAVLSVACLLLLAGQTLAASPLREIEDLKQQVAPGSAVTYTDLLKLIFPEKSTKEKETPQTPPVSSLGGYFQKQPLTAKRNEDYGGVLVLPIKAQGRPLLLLLVNAIGESVEEEGDGEEQPLRHPFNLLALFQTAATPRLLDLVDIGQMTNLGMIEGFWKGNPLIDLTPTTQACLVFQEHFNSSEGWLRLHLLWVRNQRLEKILGVFPYSCRALGEIFRSGAAFWTEPDKGREFPKVVAKLTMKVEPTPKLEECGKRQLGYTRSCQGVWRWDPAKQKYCQTSGNLNKLYKFYERYSGSPYPP